MANRNRLKESTNGDKETMTATTTPKTAQTRFNNSEQAPTLEQCQQQVREYAYELWEAAGCPEGDGSQFWLEAEEQLFGGMTEQGGYRIYIGDDKNPTPQAFILTATGLEDEKAETETEAPSSPANTKKEKVTA